MQVNHGCSYPRSPYQPRIYRIIFLSGEQNFMPEELVVYGTWDKKTPRTTPDNSRTSHERVNCMRRGTLKTLLCSTRYFAGSVNCHVIIKRMLNQYLGMKSMYPHILGKTVCPGGI